MSISAFSGVILIMALNAIWYAAKLFLHARGVRVGWFHGHFRDFGSLKQLAEQSPSEADRRRALFFLWALRGGIAVFFLVALPLLFLGFDRP